MKVFEYELKVADKVVFTGITGNLKRREKHHQLEWPSGYIVNLGKKEVPNW